MRTNPPLFMTAGFRLFFLLSALYAVVGMGLWVVWLAIHAAGAMVVQPTISIAPYQWHGHELVFGYAAGVIAGFFLTAAPNWTGAPVGRTAFLAAAGSLWLAGRLAMAFSAAIPPLAVALIDLVFLPMLSWRLALNLFRRPKPQNIALLGLIALIWAGDAMTHAEWTGLTNDTTERGLWLGVAAVSALIAVMGGRITPAFTRNAMMRVGAGVQLPRSRPWADRAGVATAVVMALALAVDAPEWLLGCVALAACLTNGIRAAGWRTRATLGEPLLWALHLGFALLVLGYGLLALAWLTHLLHPVASLHGLAIGAIGTMTLAMMTRAPLGHTGRALTAGTPIAVAYGLVALSALLRVAVPELAPSWYNAGVLVAGLSWISAFTIYAVVYWPVLTGPAALPSPQV